MKLAWNLGLGFWCFVLSGCAIKKLSPEMGNPKWGLDVTWHGHSCFTLKDSVERMVVVDPFDETVGYGRLNLIADALLITHRHFDHNARLRVKPHLTEMDVLETTGTFTVAESLQVTGLDSFHDRQQGKVNGRNIIYLFVMGGLRCVHLGDLGTTEMSDFQLKMIGKVDVLFIPVGGVTTLDAVAAKTVVDMLKPAFVFPMHYGNIRFYPLNPVEKFTALFPADRVKILETSDVRLRESDLTDQPVVYILRPTPKN